MNLIKFKEVTERLISQDIKDLDYLQFFGDIAYLNDHEDQEGIDTTVNTMEKAVNKYSKVTYERKLHSYGMDAINRVMNSMTDVFLELGDDFKKLVKDYCIGNETKIKEMVKEETEIYKKEGNINE